MRPLTSLVIGALLPFVSAALVAQEPPPLEKKPCPYTQGEERFFKRLGYHAMDSFLLTPSLRTEQVDEVVGVDRMNWIETDHFVIGCGLDTIDFPVDQQARDRVEADVAALRRKLRTIPAKPKQLGRWLRAHLTAYRLERLYREFAELTGFDPDRTDVHLGTAKKFLVLVFGKTSNMVRFYQRFTNETGDEPMRCYLPEHQQMIVVLTSDGHDGFLGRDETMHCFLVHNAVHVMLHSTHDFAYNLPPWFEEGLAHWFVRKLDERYPSVNTEEESGIDWETAWKWEERVLARVEHDFFPKAAEMYDWTYSTEYAYTDHMFAYSRVDFLINRKRGKGTIGEYIRGMHGLPPGETGVQDEAVIARNKEVMQKVFGMTPEEFDEQWKAWVMKVYPKR